MAKEKKTSKKREYLNDFQLNQNNEYEYYGIVYKLNCSQDQKNKTIRYLWLYLLIILGLALIEGCLPWSGMVGCFYIVLPYVTKIGVIGFIFYGLTIFTKNVDELREYRYKKSIGKVKGEISILMGIIIINILATIIYIFVCYYTDHDNNLFLSIFYILSNLVSFYTGKKYLDKVESLSFRITKKSNESKQQ